MNGSSWKWVWVIAGTLTCGLPAACGSDEGAEASSAGAASGGAASSGSGCTIGGTKCEFGCTPTLGCTECKVNADCKEAGKLVCVLGKCHECDVRSDCAVGQACFPKDHKCAQACSGNPDCPGDAPICEMGTGACVGCFTGADCTSFTGTPICEPTRARCSECASNADCGAASPACDLSDGKCHDCLVDSDCAEPAVCGVDRKCHVP